MERALNLDRLRLALGTGGGLPSAEELQRRLAQAEIALFLQQGTVDDDLLTTAWYLHAVGTARASLDLYPTDRQLRANQTSAHIFDLALMSQTWDIALYREMMFAAQVGYMRGGLDPNSIAIYRRRPSSVPELRDAPGEVSLDTGSSLLALDRNRLFPRIDQLRQEANRLLRAHGVADLIETPYGAASRVIEGCNELLVHLTNGRSERLTRALQSFDEAIDPPNSQSDLISRWVAAHLRDIAQDLGSTSVWAYRPPSVPPAATRAMTLGDPPVLTLWPPQLKLLSEKPNPLDPSVRRLVMSFPTSAGKTLIAQYIVVAHVASSPGSACVVVPTHSLGRELQRDLDRRMGLLGRSVEEAGPMGSPLPNKSAVIVMTPEKLASHLRNEPERMLNDYSLFLIDEAHLIGDTERGWIVESALSFLHAATLDTHHRIVLLSAALGNRSHITTWLDVGNEPAVAFHDDWIGPRRAHALFGTMVDRKRRNIVNPKGRVKLTRRQTPLHGQLHVRTGPDDHESLRTSEPIGTLIEKRANAQSPWKRDVSNSTKQYQLRASMACFLGVHGSALIVEPTKQLAQLTAKALAAKIDEEFPASSSLAALAERRLGSAHPLVDPLRKGVGFHHAALPGDIQAELEDAIRTGVLRYLVSTTTLIEGVNFPVRSVLIGERGYRTKDGYFTVLTPPKLLNAIGRAGRAGRETEGWVVLGITEKFRPDLFDQLTATDNELEAISQLSSVRALDELSAFETLLQRGEDAVMEVTGNAVSDFVSYIWFVATALDDLNRLTKDARLIGVESTLGWQQLCEADRERWRRIAELAFSVYEDTPRPQRRRWARSGTSLATASTMEAIADAVRDSLSALANRSEPVAAFNLISSQGRLEHLLNLSESRYRGFRPYQSASAAMALSVDIRGLVVGWLQGQELDAIGRTFLADVSNEEFRYAQLSEFTSSVLEHFLPWVVSTIIAWVNEGLDADEQLCPELPAYLRYGVNHPIALELSKSGVRSRRLAQRVAMAADNLTAPEAIDWLARQDVREWKGAFDASPRELADLLFCTRAKDAQITRRALAGEMVAIPLVNVTPAPPGLVSVEEVKEDAPARLAAVRDGQILGYVGTPLHEDVSRLIATGIPLVVTFTDQSTLEITVNDLENRTLW